MAIGVSAKRHCSMMNLDHGATLTGFLPVAPNKNPIKVARPRVCRVCFFDASRMFVIHLFVETVSSWLYTRRRRRSSIHGKHANPLMNGRLTSAVVAMAMYLFVLHRVCLAAAGGQYFPSEKKARALP